MEDQMEMATTCRACGRERVDHDERDVDRCQDALRRGMRPLVTTALVGAAGRP